MSEHRRLFEDSPGQPMTEEGFDITRKLGEYVKQLLEAHAGVDLRDFQGIVNNCVDTPVLHAIVTERLS